MKKFIIIKFAVIVISIVPVISYAGWADDFFANMEARSSVEGGETLQGHGGMSFNGGGWTWQGGNATLQPFRAKAPSVNAGCSGISLDFGSFSMMDEESLIAFLEQLLAAAPGYAFELAMQTFCPACLDIMNTLQGTANALNSLQFDACGTLKMAGGFLDKAISSATDGKLGSGQSNSFTQWTKTYITDPVNELNEVLTSLFSCTRGSPDCPITFFEGKNSFQEQIIAEVNKSNPGVFDYFKQTFGTGSDQDLAAVLASMTGDIIIAQSAGYTQSDKTDSGETNHNESSGKGNMMASKIDKLQSNPIGSKTMINLLTYGQSKMPTNAMAAAKTVRFIVYQYNTDKDGFTDKPTETVLKTGLQTVQSFTSEQLKGINDAFKSRNTSLSPANLNFLSTFEAPVYKVLNLYSVDPTALDNFINNFEQAAAAQYIYEIFAALASNVTPAINKFRQQVASSGLLSDNLDKDIQSVFREYGEIQNQAYLNYVEAYDRFYKSMQNNNMLQNIQKMQRAMMARHPTAGAKMFVPGLGL